jgi:predicted ABC-type ATPase
VRRSDLVLEDMDKQRKILIIAGPNGAGQTTFATEFLPREAECPNFINADLIAEGINPFRPEASSIQASKMMIENGAVKRLNRVDGQDATRCQTGRRVPQQ